MLQDKQGLPQMGNPQRRPGPMSSFCKNGHIRAPWTQSAGCEATSKVDRNAELPVKRKACSLASAPLKDLKTEFAVRARPGVAGSMDSCALFLDSMRPQGNVPRHRQEAHASGRTGMVQRWPLSELASINFLFDQMVDLRQPRQNQHY